MVNLIYGYGDRRALLFRVDLVSANGALDRSRLCVGRAQFRDNVLAAKAFAMVFFNRGSKESAVHLVLFDHAQGDFVNVNRAVPCLVHFTVRDVRHSRRRVVECVLRVPPRPGPKAHRQGVIYHALALYFSGRQRVRGVVTVPHKREDRRLRPLEVKDRSSLIFLATKDLVSLVANCGSN